MSFTRKKISWKSSRGIVFCALLLPTTIVLTAFGFGRGKTNRVPIATTELSGSGSSRPVMFQGNSLTPRHDAAHITLRRTGFYPSEITLPTGRFLLAVDNVTGMGEMSYRLLDQNSARLRDFPAKGRFRLRKVVHLPPGRYALVVTNHPDWICRIAVSAP